MINADVKAKTNVNANLKILLVVAASSF